MTRFPAAFTERILHHPGEGQGLLDALTTAPPVSVRVHPVKGKAFHLETSHRVAWCENGFYLPERPVFTLDPAFHAGAYYVQEASSMLVWQALEQGLQEKDIKVLDLCAAPGGKSTLIASWLGEKGLLVSNEIIRQRASILLENIVKWGYNNTWVTHADPYILGGLEDFFDCILVDAPCSGEGLFRKDPEAVKEWSEDNCRLCVSRQQKILHDIFPALAEGGLMIYSTCTYNPGENDESITWLLDQYPLEIVPLDLSAFPGIVATPAGGYQCYPHLVEGEGFYMAVLRKTGPASHTNEVKKQKQHVEKIKPGIFSPEKYVDDPGMYEWLPIQGMIAGIPHAWTREFRDITSITKISGGYLTLGEIKGKDLVPHHHLAMSIHCQPDVPSVELDAETALKYLAKKDIFLPGSPTGWNILTYKNLPLGFAKILPNRVNNYYPKEWQIRMQIP